VFFLNAQGRILADADLFCFADSLLLDTEPETRELVYGHLDRYIIADDVTLEDRTGETATLGLEGPLARVMLESFGGTAPEAPHETAVWEDSIVANVSSTGAGGFRIFLPSAAKEELIAKLGLAGVAGATPGEARAVRIENGVPRYGEDLTAEHIPHETQALRAIHFNKGCYLGQEIVERVRSRGHVNKLLVQLRGAGRTPPASGAPILAEGKPAGVITSAAYSPGRDEVVALGYVRADLAREGQPLEAGAVPFTVHGAKRAQDRC
jgi:aminomethyltransferase